jgi:hypothetical protein
MLATEIKGMNQSQLIRFRAELTKTLPVAISRAATEAKKEAPKAAMDSQNNQEEE